ncbi:hypothetical protein LB526_07330 [Mesorhizobium sp. CA6]|uniref:hypothetical protein n=1 Tax=Mesorhizobium sp. CA6 TaxID=588500 RepID=UPI001CCB511C|nr:hypothetical protein [Mesorhizobium sp. CA6]MBZ9766570.1 hypothetical protein [Mesorhizobium sp. CA6]
MSRIAQLEAATQAGSLVGTYRLPNEWQYARLGRLRGEKRHAAVLALGCGITVRQFAKLPLDRQQAVRRQAA